MKTLQLKLTTRKPTHTCTLQARTATGNASMVTNSANANAYRITRIAQRYTVRSDSRLSHAINASLRPTVRAKDHGGECEAANDYRVHRKK